MRNPLRYLCAVNGQSTRWTVRYLDALENSKVIGGVNEGDHRMCCGDTNLSARGSGRDNAARAEGKEKVFCFVEGSYFKTASVRSQELRTVKIEEIQIGITRSSASLFDQRK